MLNVKGMKINREKTEVMNFSRDNQNMNIFIDNHHLRQVDSFKYLGVKFDRETRQII